MTCLYIVLLIVEISAIVGISREIYRGSHTKFELLASKIAALCLDHGILVIDMYLLAAWANVLPRAEDNTRVAEAVTIHNLRSMSYSKSCIIYKSCFPIGQHLDMLINAYLHH